MSVQFAVRRLSPHCVEVLGCEDVGRLRPAFIDALIGRSFDVGPAQFDEEIRRTIPAKRLNAATRKRVAAARLCAIEEHTKAIATLEACGVSPGELGPYLGLDESWWGIPGTVAMIGSKTGARIVSERSGERVGKGYDFARLLSPVDLRPIVSSMARFKRKGAEGRFRAFETAELSKQRPASRKTLSDEAFETRFWQPLRSLRDYARETCEADHWLLKWWL